LRHDDGMWQHELPIVNGIYDREHGHAHWDGQPLQPFPPLPPCGAPSYNGAATARTVLTYHRLLSSHRRSLSSVTLHRITTYRLLRRALGASSVRRVIPIYMHTTQTTMFPGSRQNMLLLPPRFFNMLDARLILVSRTSTSRATPTSTSFGAWCVAGT